MTIKVGGKSESNLWARDAEEAAGDEQPLQRRLRVAVAHARQVEDALRVGECERVQGEDPEHLLRRNQRAPALLHQLADAADAPLATGERRRYRRVTFIYKHFWHSKTQSIK